MNTTRVAREVDVIELDIFYDYNCPFVYRATRLLGAVEASGERRLKVGWRFFSLSQVNHRSEDPADEWTVWTAPQTERVNGRLAFKAAVAARRQDRFDAFHRALLDARHAERLDIEDQAVVERVAADTGLDVARLRADIADPEILKTLETDHTEGRSKHGVFGTPTLVFPTGAAYLRLAHVVPDVDAVRVFDRIVNTIAGEPEVLEIKRPVRPVPA